MIDPITGLELDKYYASLDRHQFLTTHIYTSIIVVNLLRPFTDTNYNKTAPQYRGYKL